MSSLSHHGIKGQRWGVRRFQNKDGTRTAAGKRRNFEKETLRVINKLSNEPKPIKRRPFDKDKVRQRGLLTKVEADQCAELAAGLYKNAEQVEPKITGDVIRVVSSTSAKMYGLEHRLKQPTSIAAKIGSDAKGDGVSFEEAASGIKDTIRYTAVSDSRDYVDTYNAIKQRLRDNGYEETKCKNYFQKYQNGEVLHKAVQSTFKSPDGIDFEFQFQTPESQAAKELKLPIYNERRKAGNTPERNAHLEQEMRNLAELVPDPEGVFSIQSHSGVKNIKHTSIGGTMYIKGNALILGDSSYLEHHGIKGQRWGVRRFQNQDGSLTNAGRKRLGYATKGAAQTVGKAFKAGVKAGGNAVKAVKAHHEKKEAEKLQKKKEKASKTRLGVMANKDLFTNEEIRKLNERFKLEDEMKMATLQKGVEIAKAVGTIAQNVGTMAKAYEDVTGQSLSPIKRKAAEEKAKQDAEDRKRKLAKEDAETKRAEDKEKRDIEDRERRIKLEDEDRVRKQAKEDADAQRAENAEKRAQAKEQRDSSMAVELQRKAKAAADEQEHKAVKAKAESRSAILDVLEKIDKIQDHDDDDHNNNNPPGGGIDTWNDDDYLNFFKKTGIIHSDISDPSIIQNGVLFVDSSESLAHHGIKGQKWGVRRFQNPDGSLTEKGRKHYKKAIAKIDRMQTHSDARRGRLERQHPFAVTGAAVLGAVAAGMSIAVTGGASVAMIAAGSAISAAVSAGLTHVSYSVNEAWEGRGTKHRQKKRREYEEMLNHDGLMVLDGTLYLEHHGVRGQKWGVRRFQNKDGTRTALGKKREMYGATVSVRGQKSSESIGVTKKQAKGKAAAEILKNNKDLSEKERKKLQKHVDRAEKETAKLEKYKEKKKREQERNTEESKVRAWQALGSGVISPDKYKQNIDAINKNHKREIDYLNKMDERDMANEKAFTRKTVAKGMGYAVAATAGLAGITAATTGWMVISGYAAVGGGMVGAISGEMKRSQYRAERRKEMGIDAKHDALSIQNGVLFINAGEPYLEHHGVKGMKWGKHLMAGKSEAGAGGGGGEDDEKLKEMAKKAGMSVAEYRNKFVSKIGSTAGKVGEKISVKDKHLVINGSRSGNRGLAVGETGEKPKSFKEKAYDALGGKYKTQAAEAHREMVQKRNDADDKARRANAQGRAANANKKAGNVREYMANKEGARQLDAEAKYARTSQWEATKKANRAQWKYDHSLAGLYDKATGKYKQAHKKTAIPKMMDRWKYEYTDGPNSKLFNNGKGKAKTAKEQAKAEVWTAADHQIKAKEYNDVANSQGGNASYYGQAYKNAAEREARLAEGSYRRAAALGKQTSKETSTSSRPRARKKKHTSGGSGVTVRRPGRKPVARTKRVTKSSTGVKRRGATGTGARVRRGA